MRCDLCTELGDGGFVGLPVAVNFMMELNGIRRLATLYEVNIE
jgi:hypothetical protein